MPKLEWLEAQYGSNVSDRAGWLAYNGGASHPILEERLGAEKLAHYFALAEKWALKTYAWVEALNHFERASGPRYIPVPVPLIATLLQEG